MTEIKPSLLPQGNVLIFEYGARLDKDCIQAAGDQIIKSRRLYNDLVAAIRDIVTEPKAFVLEKSGPDARRCQEEIDTLNAAFAAARAENDEEAMKRVAAARRGSGVSWLPLSRKPERITGLRSSPCTYPGLAKTAPATRTRSAAKRWASREKIEDGRGAPASANLNQR